MIRKHRKPLKLEPEEDLDKPPVLEPEPAGEQAEYIETYDEPYENYVDENGFQQPKPVGYDEKNIVEFIYVNETEVSCGVCGDVIPLDTLFTRHMPQKHPEYADYTLERIPADHFASYPERKHVPGAYPYPDVSRPIRSTRTLRRVSQIRVNTEGMSLEALEDALRKKMVEKMGRKIPVSLVDKQHARCGICNAVLSLNKKFEIIHLVRHFNAWHPSAHKCSGQWMQHQGDPEESAQFIRPLSLSDFAVIDLAAGAHDNLQCIWCGMFMDVDSIAMHFHEIHPEEVEVPKCRLCLQELVANSRFAEKFGMELEISLPDEHHYKCGRFNLTTSTETAMDRAIARTMKRDQSQSLEDLDEEDDEVIEGDDSSQPEPFSNSRMSFGKRNKPKRQFIMPALRQAAPANSKFIEPITDCHWRCKLCNGDILAAVISAGAIKHYRSNHQSDMEEMQMELCKARLERVSDGCMELLSPKEIECLICGMVYPLHKPYNMCRAIRHLKLKHPEQMPEHNAPNAQSSK